MKGGPRRLLADAEGTTQWVTRNLAQFASQSTPNFASRFGGHVDLRCQAVAPEQSIKEGKEATHWTRLSCHRFRANEIRLLLGISIQSRQPVATLIAQRFPFTLRLAFLAILVSAVLGVVAGIIAATRRNSVVDLAALFGALVGISLPIFWLGLLMILVFSVRLHWFPAGGSGTLAHLVLPAIVLGAAATGVLNRPYSSESFGGGSPFFLPT